MIDRDKDYKERERTASQSQLTQTSEVSHQDSTKEYYKRVHQQQLRRATATMDDINKTIGGK